MYNEKGSFTSQRHKVQRWNKGDGYTMRGIGYMYMYNIYPLDLWPGYHFVTIYVIGFHLSSLFSSVIWAWRKRGRGLGTR